MTTDSVMEFVCSLDVLPSSARTYAKAIITGAKALGYRLGPPLALDSIAYTGIYNPIHKAPELPVDFLDRLVVSPPIPVLGLVAFLYLTGRRAGDLLCMRHLLFEGQSLECSFVGTKSDRLGKPEFLAVTVPTVLMPFVASMPFPVEGCDVDSLRVLCRGWGITPKSFRVSVIRRLDSIGWSLSDIALLTGHHDLSVMADSYLCGKVASRKKKQLAITVAAAVSH